MRNIILIALSLFISSCFTRKYGCGLSQTPKELASTYANTDIKTMKSISFPEIKNIKYVAPLQHIFRSYGDVSIIDTSRHPYKYLIRIGGVVVKDDTDLTDVKFIIAHEGSFTKCLNPFLNKTIYFECKSIYPNIYVPNEILEVVDGCVESEVINYVDEKGNIVFRKL